MHISKRPLFVKKFSHREKVQPYWEILTHCFLSTGDYGVSLRDREMRSYIGSLPTILGLVRMVLLQDSPFGHDCGGGTKQWKHNLPIVHKTIAIVFLLVYWLSDGGVAFDWGGPKCFNSAQDKYCLKIIPSLP